MDEFYILEMTVGEDKTLILTYFLFFLFLLFLFFFLKKFYNKKNMYVSAP